MKFEQLLQALQGPEAIVLDSSISEASSNYASEARRTIDVKGFVLVDSLAR